MLSYDKIINSISPEVIDTMKQLANQGDVARLKTWHSACVEEIQRKAVLRENTYSLYCEKYYLEMLLD